MPVKHKHSLRFHFREGLGSQRYHGHMNLIICGMWRGVEKASAAVVENVFAVVGSVYQSGGTPGVGQHSYYTVENGIGIKDRVVVGVHKLLAVSGTGFACVVRVEMVETIGVTLAVIEM